jgi:hypothetical protein
MNTHFITFFLSKDGGYVLTLSIVSIKKKKSLIQVLNLQYLTQRTPLTYNVFEHFE